MAAVDRKFYISLVLLTLQLLHKMAALNVHIGTMFSPPGTQNQSSLIFNQSVISDIISENTGSDPLHVHIIPIDLPVIRSASDVMLLCEAVASHNISLFAAVGNAEMMNLLSLVGTYVDAPLLGYTSTEETSTRIIPTKHYNRRLYTELNPDPYLQAEAVSKMLFVNKLNSTCLLVQDALVSDHFVETLRQRSLSNKQWVIEKVVEFGKRELKLDIHYKLLNLQENQCTVLLVHASAQLAKNIFFVSNRMSFMKFKYTWLLTDAAFTTKRSILQEYPVGVIVFKVSENEGKHSELVAAMGRHVRDTVTAFHATHRGALQSHITEMGGKQCFGSKAVQRDTHNSELFREYLEEAIFTPSDEMGHVGRVWNHVPMATSIQVLTLLKNTRNHKRWKSIGSYNLGELKVATLTWPGILQPPFKVQRTLRVVTAITPPFVTEHEAIHGNCSHSVPCLRVDTKNKAELEDIFDDYQQGIHYKHRPYTVKCCKGFSIALLKTLSNEINFNIQLYITSDDRYGDLNNGTWTGLVQDLMDGLAHMSVAPFSVTRKRSTVIDFTHPYFYSSFAILVSEKKRPIPLYAFTEPFDQWVWISIVISATVVAIVLAVFEWNSPFGLNPWGRKRKSNYTLGSGLTMVYAILFGHTVKTKSPKAWPSKWLQNFWAGASIFIYSSYTANLAAFLAGKSSGVTISGIYDMRLLESGQSVGVITGTAVEDYVHEKSRLFPPSLRIESALDMLLNDTLDAFIDDSSILEHARETLDVKCKLRMVNNGFGQDLYSIGLPKDSWLKDVLDKEILRFHENGYIEELTEEFFRQNQCNKLIKQELQGEADRMEFNQHAGLYLLLAVGIFMCILLLLLEHATFKLLVPYWRLKPKGSFWKTMSMMFWSQRLHRIITSEELVSPHHSAREMIQVMKNRDFTKLFQKSVKKQDRLVRNRKNIFNLVEQLKWEKLKHESTTAVTYTYNRKNIFNLVEQLKWEKLKHEFTTAGEQGSRNASTKSADSTQAEKKQHESITSTAFNNGQCNDDDVFINGSHNNQDRKGTSPRHHGHHNTADSETVMLTAEISPDNSDYLDEDDYLTYKVQDQLAVSSIPDSTCLLIRPKQMPVFIENFKSLSHIPDDDIIENETDDEDSDGENNEQLCITANSNHDNTLATTASMTTMTPPTVSDRVMDRLRREIDRHDRLLDLESMTKEQVYVMWKTTENELCKTLRRVLCEKERLENEKRKREG